MFRAQIEKKNKGKMDKPSQSPAAHTREPFIYHATPSDQNLARQAPGEMRERKREAHEPPQGI